MPLIFNRQKMELKKRKYGCPPVQEIYKKAKQNGTKHQLQKINSRLLFALRRN